MEVLGLMLHDDGAINIARGGYKTTCIRGLLARCSYLTSCQANIKPQMVSFSLCVVAGALAASRLISAALPPAAQRLRSSQTVTEETYPSLHEDEPEKRSTPQSDFTIPVFSNPTAANYHVNSSALPLVTFPLQDSWSGQLPISASATESRKLFFWYWPSSAAGGSDSLTIWLNGS